jgi:hypothetical protein
MIVCSAAAMLLSAVLFHFADAWFGQDTSVLGASRQIVYEVRRSQALRARAEMVSRSLDIKRDIIARLLDGRLSFRQAIVQFQKANELVEKVDLDLIAVYRSPTNSEGVARQVFLWARNAVSAWPADKSQRLLAGFESEFRALFSGSKLGEEFEVRSMDISPNGRTETNSSVW